MQVVYFGQSCFRIKGKQVTLLINPYADKQEKMPKLRADIAVFSLPPREEASKRIKGGIKRAAPFLIDSVGEYEVLETTVFAFKNDGGLLFVFEIDEVKLVYLWGVAGRLEDSLLEKIGEVDLLFVFPGKEGLSVEEAMNLVSQIEPKVIIPSGSFMDEFIEKLGIERSKREKKFVINKGNLPDEQEVVVLSKV